MRENDEKGGIIGISVICRLCVREKQRKSARVRETENTQKS